MKWIFWLLDFIFKKYCNCRDAHGGPKFMTLSHSKHAQSKSLRKHSLHNGLTEKINKIMSVYTCISKCVKSWTFVCASINTVTVYIRYIWPLVRRSEAHYLGLLYCFIMKVYTTLLKYMYTCIDYFSFSCCTYCNFNTTG